MLREVSDFLKRTGMPETVFGRRVIGDPRLVGDLRRGRELRPATVSKIRAFIAEHGS